MVQQYIERNKKSMNSTKFYDYYDKFRTLRMVSFVALFMVPFLHKFHAFIDVLWLRMGIYNKIFSVITKVSVDQLICMPPMMTLFTFYMKRMEGYSINEYISYYNNIYWDLWIESWSVWTPGHCVTYSLPFKYRTIWCDILRVYFGTRMSYHGNRH